MPDTFDSLIDTMDDTLWDVLGETWSVGGQDWVAVLDRDYLEEQDIQGYAPTLSGKTSTMPAVTRNVTQVTNGVDTYLVVLVMDQGDGETILALEEV